MMITSFSPHHMPFMPMLSTKYIYILYKFKHIINTTTVRLLQKFHHYYHEDCRLLANGMRNIQFGMPLLLHYSFGQKISIQLPLVKPQNTFTLPFSGHLPVTHYANSLGVLL